MVRMHGAAALVSSDLNRGAYRAKNPADRSSTLASFYGSGAIERRFDCALVAVEEGDLVRVDFAKNRFGEKLPFFLRHDPNRAIYLPVDAGLVEQKKTEAKEDAHRQRIEKISSRIREVLLEHREGLTTADLLDRIPIKRPDLIEAREAMRHAFPPELVEKKKPGKGSGKLYLLASVAEDEVKA
jgi:hypothetical protein